MADNGLSFYSLQALFWNQLFLPGEKTVNEQMLHRFTCGLADMTTTVPRRLQEWQYGISVEGFEEYSADYWSWC